MGTELNAYPAELEADVILADGGTAHVRPIRPDDADRLVALHSRLSAESIYYRFFNAHPKLSDAEVTRFTTVDYVHRLALVLLLGDELIAVARYEGAPGRDHAEVAFTVDDAHQQRGIATLLLEHLAAAARSHGIHHFTATVLPDNRRMGMVFRHAGFDAKAGFADGVIEFRLELDPTPEAMTRLAEKVDEREHNAERQSILPLLQPQSVAVIGASSDPSSLGHHVVRTLVLHGFKGRVHPINHGGVSVAGVPALPSVADVPGRVDLAIVAVPAKDVSEALACCAAERVRAVVVLTAGIGRDESQQLGEFARANGMRLVGPASLGVFNFEPGVVLHASFAQLDVKTGHVGVAVESGVLGAALLDRATRAGIRFSSVVSLGAKVDVSANDLLHYWLDDETTTVVMLYGESLGNPRNFTRLARRFAAEKALITIAPDDGEAGWAAALYRQLGVVRTRTVEELLDATRLIEAVVVPKGERVTVISDSDNAGEVAMQSLRAQGLTVTGCEAVGFAATPADYRAAATRTRDATDAFMIIYAPALGGDASAVSEAVLSATRESAIPAVLVSNGGSADNSPLPLFRFPESAALALSHLVELGRTRRRDSLHDHQVQVALDEPAARAIVEEVLLGCPAGRELRWDEGVRLLATVGIEVIAGAVVTSLDAGLETAAALGYPVAIKAMGLARLGRTEAGGVALDLHDAASLTASYQRMRDALGEGMREALVQRLVRGQGIECVVAVEPHELFGPVVGVGIGGILADRVGRQPRRALPLTEQDAHELVNEAPVSELLRDRALSIDSVVDLVRRIGTLADTIHELSLVRCNPILVTASGAAVLSARLIVGPAPSGLPVRRL